MVALGLWLATLPGAMTAASQMSAMGQKQTFAVQTGMSALTLKADMGGATRDVRFVPKADIDLRAELGITKVETKGV